MQVFDFWFIWWENVRPAQQYSQYLGVFQSDISRVVSCAQNWRGGICVSCEGSYQGIVDSSIDLCEFKVEFTNMGSEPFEYYMHCCDTSTTQTITVKPYKTDWYYLRAKETGSGMSTYFLKKSWNHQSIMSIDDWFSSVSSTLLQIDFVVCNEKILAFCMLCHKRLGNQNTSSLNRDQVSMICKLLHWYRYRINKYYLTTT